MSDEATPHVKHDLVWEVSVTAEAKNTSITTVAGPADAYEFLTNKWSDTRGPTFARAKRAAMGAIAGTGSSEDARVAFVAACLAAGCLVEVEGS